MIYCEDCGSKLPDNSGFCSNCKQTALKSSQAIVLPDAQKLKQTQTGLEKTLEYLKSYTKPPESAAKQGGAAAWKNEAEKADSARSESAPEPENIPFKTAAPEPENIPFKAAAPEPENIPFKTAAPEPKNIVFRNNAANIIYIDEVYTEIDLNSKNKKRRSKKIKAVKTKTKSSAFVQVLLIILNLAVIGALFFNFTPGGAKMRGIDPILTLFGRESAYNEIYGSYWGKYQNILKHVDYAFMVFAAVALISLAIRLAAFAAKRSAKGISLILHIIMAAFLIAVAVLWIMIFKQFEALNAIGLYAAFAAVVLKMIICSFGFKKIK